MQFIGSHNFCPVKGVKSIQVMSSREELIATLQHPSIRSKPIEVICVMGQSGLAKTTTVHGCANKLTGDVDCGLRVGIATAHQTKEIDAVLLISKERTRPSYLILDVAGHDHGVSPLEANTCNGLSIAISTKTCHFVAGDLTEADIISMANFARIAEAITTAPAPHPKLLIISSPAKGQPGRFVQRPGEPDATAHFRDKMDELTAPGVAPAKDFLRHYFGDDVFGHILPIMAAARNIGVAEGDVASYVPASQVFEQPGVIEGFRPLVERILAPTANMLSLPSAGEIADKLAAAHRWTQTPEGVAILSTDYTNEVGSLINSILLFKRNHEEKSILDKIRVFGVQNPEATSPEIDAFSAQMLASVTAAKERIRIEGRKYHDVAAIDAVPCVRDHMAGLTATCVAAWGRVKQNVLRAREEKDAARAKAAADRAKSERNDEILRVLQAEREHIYQASRYLGGHNAQYHGGRHNFLGVKVRDHSWSCGCGMHQSGGGQPGGQCPNNVGYSQPTWEAYRSSLGAPDGPAWRLELQKRGYDWR